MNKWRCVKLGGTLGFTEGRIYEVETDGTIYYNSGNESSEKLSINGNKAKCWQVKFEKVEEDKIMNKFKVGDIIKGTERGSNYAYTNKNMTKGKVTKVYESHRHDADDIEVEVLEHKNNEEIGSKYSVRSEKFDLYAPSKKSIHITFDNDTTHAIVKEDGKIVKREKVGLFKGDVYDEATGVREVIDKLYGKKVDCSYKEVNRKAKVGEYVKIVNAYAGSREFYNDGDIMKVTEVRDTAISTKEAKTEGIFHREYVVLEGYVLSDKNKSISEYTTDELLSEIKRRMEE